MDNTLRLIKQTSSHNIYRHTLCTRIILNFVPTHNIAVQRESVRLATHSASTRPASTSVLLAFTLPTRTNSEYVTPGPATRYDIVTCHDFLQSICQCPRGVSSKVVFRDEPSSGRRFGPLVRLSISRPRS